MRPSNPFRRIMRTEDPSPAFLTTDAESVSCDNDRARVADISDAELIERFVYERDQAAFTCIVERYSRLVLGVALRHLRDRNRAEDAFQATFLVLAENARKIRKRKSLASWLHGVARRVALRTMSEVKRETTWEAAMEPAQDMLDDVVQAFEQQALDKELAQLPEKYRDPLTLHYLEGLSHAEIAKRLGLSIAAVDGRLKRGRTDLRLKLVRRGVSLSVAVGVFHFSQQAVQAATFPTLVSSTSVAAQSWVAGTAVSTCTPNAVLLAGKEIAVMAAAKTTMVLSITGAVCLAAGMVIASGQGGGGSGDGEGGQPGASAAVTGDGNGGGEGFVVELTNGESASGTSDSQPSIDVIGEGGGAIQSGAGGGEASGTSSAEGGSPYSGEGGAGFSSLFGSDGDVTGTTDYAADFEELRIYSLVNVSASDVVETINTLIPDLQIAVDERSNSVLLAASPEVQDVIEAILLKLDEAPAVGESMPGRAQMMMGGRSEMMGMPGMSGSMGTVNPVYGYVSEGRQRIESALDETTRVEFQAIPLRDAMDYISTAHNIPVRVDESALGQEGISPDDEITFTISELTLQNALDLMLEDVGGVQLAYFIRNDVLFITTENEAADMMETLIYEMRGYQGLNPAIATQLIQEGTNAEWVSKHGIGGAIVPLQGGLMIRQTQHAHHEIQALLEQIQQFTSAGLETPPEWLEIDGSGYVPGMMGGMYGAGSEGMGGGFGYGGEAGMPPGMSGGFSYGMGAGGMDPMGGTGEYIPDEILNPSELGPGGDFGGGDSGFEPQGGGLGTGTQFDTGAGDASTGSPDAFDSSTGGFPSGSEGGEFDEGETSIPGGPDAIGP